MHTNNFLLLFKSISTYIYHSSYLFNIHFAFQMEKKNCYRIQFWITFYRRINLLEIKAQLFRGIENGKNNLKNVMKCSEMDKRLFKIMMQF